MATKVATNLTERAISRTKPKVGERIRLHDHIVAGLVLDCSPKRFVWRFRYQLDGKRRTVKLGEHPAVDIIEARRRVAELRHKQRDRRAAGITVAELAERYVDGWARLEKATWREDKADLDKRIVPHLGADRPVSEVERRDLAALAQKLRAEYQSQRANRLFAVARRMFRWARSVDLITADPTVGVPQPVKKASRREQTPTVDQLVELWHATDEGKTSGAVRGLVRTLLLTGIRPTEARNLEWEWVQKDRIVIPSRGTKTKSDPHIVPRTAMLNELLAEIEPSDLYLFHGRDPLKPLESKTAGQWLKRRIGYGFILHDIRRGIASWMVGEGIDTEVARRVLGHRPEGMLGEFYLHEHAMLPMVRGALERWQTHLSAII